MNKNSIFIVGAGTIGKALAVFLTHKGKEVVLLRGSVDQQPDTFRAIEVVLGDSKTLSASVQVSTFSNYPVLNGLIVVTSKSYGNQHIAGQLVNRTASSPIIILQNGLNIERPFTDNGFSNIYRCVLFATSQYIGSDKLRFAPVAVSPIGVIAGDDKTLNEVVEALDSTYFRFTSERNIQPLIWTKAIINSVFNSVCPLLETDNGIFCRNVNVLAVAKRVIAECVTVAQSQNVQLNAEMVLEQLLLISRVSAGQFISTYQDIKNRRQTEIQTLNLAIAGAASEIGLVKETALLGELISIKAALGMKHPE